MKKIFFLFLVMCVILFSSCANLKLTMTKSMDLSGYWSFSELDRTYFTLYEIEYPNFYFGKNKNDYTIKYFDNFLYEQKSEYELKLIGYDEILITRKEKGPFYDPAVKEARQEIKGRIVSKDLIYFYYLDEIIVYENNTEKTGKDYTGWLRKIYTTIKTVDNIFKTGTLTINSNYEDFKIGEKYSINLETIADEFFPNYSENATLTLSSGEKNFKIPLDFAYAKNEVHRYPIGGGEINLILNAKNEKQEIYLRCSRRLYSEDFSTPDTSSFRYKGNNDFATLEW